MVHDIIGALPTPVMLVLVGLAVVTESALLIGLVLPGSTMLLALGLATRLGDVPLSAAIPVAVAAAITGGQLAYLRGRRPSTRRVVAGKRAGRAGKLRTTIERAEDLVSRHGALALATSQWISGLRTFTPRLAGRARVPYRVFGATQIPIAAVWAAAFVSLGHFAGLAAQQQVGTAATVAGIVLVGIALIVYAVRRHTTDKATGGREPAPQEPELAPVEPVPANQSAAPWMCFPW